MRGGAGVVSAFSWAVLLAAVGGVTLSLSALVLPRLERILPALALGLFTAAGVCVLVGLA